MKLTIIPVDGNVRKDGISFVDLDLSSCGIPSGIHALQWNENNGWIEYESALVDNETITELPVWATACIEVWTQKNVIELNKTSETSVASVSTDAEKLILIKAERNYRLSSSDWTQISDVISLHDQAWLDSWKVYRQKLRDLPSTLTNYDDVFYPLPPNA